VCGDVSGRLTVIDLDGDKAVRVFREKFPRLFNETYAVQTGKGYHLYFFTDDPVKNKTLRSHDDIAEIGIRSHGGYVVAAPSVHPSGKLYTSCHKLYPMHLENLNAVAEWLDELKPRRIPKPMVQPTPSSTINYDKSEAYIRSYIERGYELSLNDVRHAGKNNRNNTLFLASIAIGQLVSSEDNRRYGVIGYHTAFQDLVAAASHLSASDGVHSTMKTVNSGMQKGLREPRNIPAPRERRYGQR
jgi:hypothetical protein